MFEARGDQGFAEESDLADMATGDELLDRDVALELVVARARNAAEATASVLIEDFVAIRCTKRSLHERDGFFSRRTGGFGRSGACGHRWGS